MSRFRSCSPRSRPRWRRPRTCRFNTVKLAGASAGTEPRIAIDKNDDRWVVTNGGGAVVDKSTNGGEDFTKVPGKWTQASATIDVDIVAMDLGQKLPRSWPPSSTTAA